MQRDRTLKIGLSQRLEIGLPINHSLAERAVDLSPAFARLLPVRVLDCDHLDARRGQVERYLPSCSAPFSDRMPDVEIVTDPFRVELINSMRNVPDLRGDGAFVIVESALVPALFAHLGQRAEVVHGLL